MWTWIKQFLPEYLVWTALDRFLETKWGKHFQLWLVAAMTAYLGRLVAWLADLDPTWKHDLSIVAATLTLGVIATGILAFRGGRGAKQPVADQPKKVPRLSLTACIERRIFQLSQREVTYQSEDERCRDAPSVLLVTVKNTPATYGEESIACDVEAAITFYGQETQRRPGLWLPQGRDPRAEIAGLSSNPVDIGFGDGRQLVLLFQDEAAQHSHIVDVVTESTRRWLTTYEGVGAPLGTAASKTEPLGRVRITIELSHRRGCEVWELSLVTPEQEGMRIENQPFRKE